MSTSSTVKFSRRLAVGLVLGAAAFAGAPVQAALLAYEGFDYAPGSALGEKGGWGWSGGWMDVGGSGGLEIVPGGLMAGSRAPGGYDLHSVGGSLWVRANSRAGRWLDCSPTGSFAQAGLLDVNGNIGAAGKTLYLSFLQRPSDTLKFYEFEFHRGDLGDAGRIGGIGNDLNSTTVNLRANSVQTPLGPGDTNVNFYVLRIDYRGGNDDVFVYRNPTASLEAGNVPALKLSGVGDLSFNGLSLAAYLNGVTVRHDEIRLGETWSDVLENPPGLAAQPTHPNRFANPGASPPALSRQMTLTNNLLNLPVENNAPMRRVTISVDGHPVRDFKIKLANGVPDWWAFVDVSAFQGQAATISINSLAARSTGLTAIVQTNGIVNATDLYQETLRPQVHFSSRRGWLNDANGMFWYRGQYHLYYQHDPFNWDGSGQKYWGHAVSPDMVHWDELPEGIYSHAYGDDVWSGSAVVDAANTSGFKAGSNDVIVAAFYSTGRGECIDYSNDGGLTFAEYTNNPVVVHATTGRDPHLLWYTPSNYWVMAVYDATGGNGVSFYSSPNLRKWTYRSKISGFFECPDLFELPVDGDANNLQWVLCDASSGYMLGKFDGTTFWPSTAKLPGNQGSGYYASQTFTSMSPGDGRKVRIGWAQLSMPGMPFNQMMFFPTTLTLKTLASGIRLCSQPVAEITNAFANSYSWTNLTLSPGSNPLSRIRGRMFDVLAQFTPGSAQAISFMLCGVAVSYSPSTRQIICQGDAQSLPPINGTVTLEIITDRQSVEIFGNGGQLYMPVAAASYSAANNMLSLTSQGASTTFGSLTVNQLKSIWPAPGRRAIAGAKDNDRMRPPADGTFDEH